MARTVGLSDSQRSMLSLAIGVLGAIQAFIVANTLIGGNTSVPPEAIWIIALVMAALGPIREYAGVRDASTSRIAKEVDGSIPQYRSVPGRT